MVEMSTMASSSVTDCESPEPVDIRREHSPPRSQTRGALGSILPCTFGDCYCTCRSSDPLPMVRGILTLIV